MRVVHFSDWHGQLRALPRADLYVCTGDMLPNYRVPSPEGLRRGAAFAARNFSDVDEARWQAAWVARENLAGGFARYIPDTSTPIVCVRGNHDFVDLAPLFVGLRVIELVDNELAFLRGLRITGHRGSPLFQAVWTDETAPERLLDQARRMPEADLYLTHYPPQGILDCGHGLPGLAEVLESRDAIAYHFFGHIHEVGGSDAQVGLVTYSNAAQSINVIEV
jgi:Icc-related predicted phosphoesterase